MKKLSSYARTQKRDAFKRKFASEVVANELAFRRVMTELNRLALVGLRDEQEAKAVEKMAESVLRVSHSMLESSRVPQHMRVPVGLRFVADLIQHAVLADMHVLKAKAGEPKS